MWYKSRPAWACELKFSVKIVLYFVLRHAPRGRVSWNLFRNMYHHLASCHAPRGRVSWNQIRQKENDIGVSHAPRGRVSWNLSEPADESTEYGHAPRGRVSWNETERISAERDHVTPHVGVWVEIYLNFTTDSDGGSRLSCAWGVECLIGWYITQGIGSRPSWVWELKCSRLWSVRYNPRHTPSGCDSWNHPTTQPSDNIPVTLHELTMKKMPKLSGHMLS